MKKSYCTNPFPFVFYGVLVFAQNVFAQEESPQSLKEVAKGQIDTVKNLIELVTEFFVKYSFQFIGGCIVLILGWVLARFLGKLVAKFFEKRNIDVTVAKFSVSTVKMMVMLFAVIVAMGKFGIEIAPLIAGVSVAGFGLSFALQGPLSNYAAGAVLIFTKPFKVDDIIEVAGVMGKVIDLKLPRTELKTVDGNMIIVPNKHIVGEVIQNYSVNKKLDINVGVSYDADIDKAVSIVEDVVRKDKRITKANIGISEFADSSINIYSRLWCSQDEYWNVMFSVNKAIFDEFKKQGITIPFPQRDVHIIKES